LEVKIETDSNDAMEIKTEADSNDITECQHDDRPSVGMFDLLCVYIPLQMLGTEPNRTLS